MIISDSFYLSSLSTLGSVPAWHPDPARLAAGVLAGMGFLGAGVIIRQTGHVVRGVTTAATLWFATVVGLAFGSGATGIGLVGVMAAIVILYLFPRIESFIQDDWYSDCSIVLDTRTSSIDEVLNVLKSLGLKVKGIDIRASRESSEQHLLFRLKYKKTDLTQFPITVTQSIGKLPGILKIHWHA